jgi:N-carbamoyl-L-amino-acid hydrolase
MAPKIDPERLLNDLKALRAFGACGPGVVRPSFSDSDMAARRWLSGRMAEAGLEARIDGVGNVIGRSPKAGRALLMGSHTDTQPRGGWLDGALGVIYALEAARALAEDPASAPLPLDIASWMDEEGSYLGCLGSASFAEALDDAEMRRATNAEGRSVAEALEAAGLAQEAPARLEPERHAAYLEAHIEQGPVLETEGKRIGVVTSIVGMRRFTLSFSGQQNHAGTTPMALRRDAGDALIVPGRQAARGAARAPRRTHGLHHRPGRLRPRRRVDHPGPGRDEPAVSRRRGSAARPHGSGGAAPGRRGEPSRPGPGRSTSRLEGALMDSGLQDHLAAAAERHAPGQWMRMPSGAAHDAQVLARRLPSAMLFVPSIGGISHDFAEDTAEADIALGCQIFASAAASVLETLNAG